MSKKESIEKLKSELEWKKRSAKISGSWGDKAGKRKALREAREIEKEITNLEDNERSN